MSDLNIADALNAIKAQLTTVIANQATPVPTTVDLTPVLTAVQAVSDKIDAIDTPTAQPMINTEFLPPILPRR